MKRPQTSTLIIGHPVIGTALVLLAVFVGYVALVSGESGVVFFCLLLGGAVGHTIKVAGDYRAWNREWEAMDPSATPRAGRSPRRAIVFLMFLAGLALGWFYALPAILDPSSPARWITAAATGVIALGWIARRRRARVRVAASSDWTVSQCVPRPMRAPSAAEAFTSLPEHCARLLSPPGLKEPHA
ncbi:hypothetical protein [Caulobacter sp. DWP3-1-3b2]|uniref:hypothetical protein n=1 Tax=Caulobacter sp. DWP3-1-3b2 TaxID=2804643 RepID=UPI003CF7AB4B